MHEHGLMTKLFRTALREASDRRGALRTIRVRLGALAGSDLAHFRADFEHVREELGLGPIGLELEVDGARPTGVELVSIEVADRGRDG